MKIGVRAHDYGKMEIEDLARVLHEEGYDAAQLALPKAAMRISRLLIWNGSDGRLNPRKWRFRCLAVIWIWAIPTMRSVQMHLQR